MAPVTAHFNVNVSAVTRTLPRHLRAAFTRELTERLEARIGQLTTAADIAAIAQDVLREIAVSHVRH